MKELLTLLLCIAAWSPFIVWALREDLGKLPDGTDRIERWWLP